MNKDCRELDRKKHQQIKVHLQFDLISNVLNVNRWIRIQSHEMALTLYSGNFKPNSTGDYLFCKNQCLCCMYNSQRLLTLTTLQFYCVTSTYVYLADNQEIMESGMTMLGIQWAMATLQIQGKLLLQTRGHMVPYVHKLRHK